MLRDLISIIEASRTPSVKVDAFQPWNEWFYQKPVVIVTLMDMFKQTNAHCPFKFEMSKWGNEQQRSYQARKSFVKGGFTIELEQLVVFQAMLTQDKKRKMGSWASAHISQNETLQKLEWQIRTQCAGLSRSEPELAERASARYLARMPRWKL